MGSGEWNGEQVVLGSDIASTVTRNAAVGCWLIKVDCVSGTIFGTFRTVEKSNWLNSYNGRSGLNMERVINWNGDGSRRWSMIRNYDGA